ncbi:MAG: hypothetical protein ACR2MW_04975, partial [Chthoniobacterales bacterium]
PATVQGGEFSVAQVAAFGTSLHPRNAQDAGNADVSENDGGGKEMADGKSILDDKNIPAAGPEEAQPPGEGPPPPLPDVPPFTFIPQVVPQMPPTSP